MPVSLNNWLCDNLRLYAQIAAVHDDSLDDVTHSLIAIQAVWSYKLSDLMRDLVDVDKTEPAISERDSAILDSRTQMATVAEQVACLPW